MCKSPTPLKRQNKMQNHSILLINFYKRKVLSGKSCSLGQNQHYSRMYRDGTALPIYALLCNPNCTSKPFMEYSPFILSNTRY